MLIIDSIYKVFFFFVYGKQTWNSALGGARYYLIDWCAFDNASVDTQNFW